MKFDLTPILCTKRMISCAARPISATFRQFEVDFLSFLHVFVCIGGPIHRDVATLGPPSFFWFAAQPPSNPRPGVSTHADNQFYSAQGRDPDDRRPIRPQ